MGPAKIMDKYLVHDYKGFEMKGLLPGKSPCRYAICSCHPCDLVLISGGLLPPGVTHGCLLLDDSVFQGAPLLGSVSDPTRLRC